MTDQTPGTSIGPENRGNRQLWLAILIVGAIVIPRSIAISQAHSEYVDDEYHRTRGLAFLHRDLASVDVARGTVVNDPPAGEGIVALPFLVVNLAEGRSSRDPGLYHHRVSPEVLLGFLAAWKAILFLPMVGVVFAWCRAIHGLRSAWLSAGLLAAEPNFAAHIPTGSLDVLAVEAIVIACYLAWRSFENPTKARQRAAGVALAAAMAIKHTALILPAVLLTYGLIRWVWEAWLDRQSWARWTAELRPRLGALGRSTAVGLLALWAFTLFDVSPRSCGDLWVASNVPAETVKVWPGGAYMRAVEVGTSHNRKGHPAYLLGETSRMGWWYYFEVIAAYKVPIGVAGVMLMAVASIAWDRPRRAEWSLAIPALAFVALTMMTTINIGFRHFLPAYIFLLMLSTRCVADTLVARVAARGRVLAWVAVAAAGLHAASFHPDYLSYLNAPWSKPYLAISDSNLDWGQGLKEVRSWIDARPIDGRKVTLAYFGNLREAPRHYLGDRATVTTGSPPEEGLLIVSPVIVAGPYDRESHFARFRSIEPIDVIGRSLLVFDLDRLEGAKVRK
jgi:hypothetical protein